MFLDNMQCKSVKKTQGSALFVALFVMVIMMLLGTAMVKIMSSSAETIAYEVIGTRAYQAANSGAQRKLSEVFPLNSGSSTCLDSNYNFLTIKGLENCRAKLVTCTKFDVSEISYYTIKSVGECVVADVVTSRTIEVRARSL